MAGRPGRSGGHNRLTSDEHKLKGTYRKARHASAVPALSVGSQHAEPPHHLLDGLGADGVRFVQGTFADFEVGRTEASVVRLAGQALDDIAMARAAGDLKSARAAGRQFLAALQRLGIPTQERS